MSHTRSKRYYTVRSGMQQACPMTSRLDLPRRTSSEIPVVMLKRARTPGERGTWQGRSALQRLPSKRERHDPHGRADQPVALMTPLKRVSQSNSTIVEKCTRTAGTHGPWQGRPVVRRLMPSDDQRRYLNGCSRTRHSRPTRDVSTDRLKAGGAGTHQS